MELPMITKIAIIITALLLLAGCAEPSSQAPGQDKSSEADDIPAERSPLALAHER